VDGRTVDACESPPVGPVAAAWPSIPLEATLRVGEERSNPACVAAVDGAVVGASELAPTVGTGIPRSVVRGRPVAEPTPRGEIR
jgi:hypothetical protein